MPRRGARIGVLVIAGGEVGSAIGEEAKAVGPELLVITLEIVAAKLVDDEDDDKFGIGLISRPEACERCE